jgi:hypothetical protein
MSTRYSFLPWVRHGAASAVRNPDTLGPGLPLRPLLPVGLRVNGRSDVAASLQLYGPGDVTGLDSRAILRSDPPHLADGFEPNYFPAIEFDRPDLPWLFTPATGDAQGRLRPWICMVVVRKQPGVSLGSDRVRPLPVLAIRPPAIPSAELPDLGESWAWAHAQVVSADNTPLRDLLAPDADESLSRLICPRRLAPGQSYFACLAPAFETGRRAGLGEPEPPTEAGLAPAWRLGPTLQSIELPVYYHWEFSTGADGDFESLARRLHPGSLPAEVGSRPLSLAHAGFGLPDGGSLPMEGALRLPRPADAPAPTTPAAFAQSLLVLLNMPETLRRAGDPDPIVAPPTYSSWQAAQTLSDQDAPAWMRRLNLDPRYRAAAGVGALVIQDQQEQLMASAWDQLGAPGEERKRRGQFELGQEVLGVVHGKLAQLSPERMIQVTGPLHARVNIERSAVIFSGQPPDTKPATVREQIRRSQLTDAVTSAPFRRMTRARGPVLRQASVANGRPSGTRIFTTGSVPIAARVAAPATSVTPQAIEEQLRKLIVLSTMLREASEFNAAARALESYLADATGSIVPPPVRPTLAVGELKSALLKQLDPSATAAQPLALGQAPTSSAGPETTRLPAPSFPQPMYEALRELAPDLLLPGIAQVPPDSVTLLQTNPALIESFMAGLNHEMSRELLWREYPSDLRATYFQRFWAAGGPGGVELPELRDWEPKSELGSHMDAGSGAGHLVLLLRGELLRRYPGAVIYALRAASRSKAGTEKKYPLFRAGLTPDITCIGFDLSLAAARGAGTDPGWFIVIEQPPVQNRFGLDASEETGHDPAELSSWNNLAWGDMAASPAELAALTHAPVAGRLLQRKIGPLEWGLNGGHMAAITRQLPVRVLLHAAELLPEKVETSIA